MIKRLEDRITIEAETAEPVSLEKAIELTVSVVEELREMTFDEHFDDTTFLHRLRLGCDNFLSALRGQR